MTGNKAPITRHKQTISVNLQKKNKKIILVCSPCCMLLLLFISQCGHLTRRQRCFLCRAGYSYCCIYLSEPRRPLDPLQTAAQAHCRLPNKMYEKMSPSMSKIVIQLVHNFGGKMMSNFFLISSTNASSGVCLSKPPFRNFSKFRTYIGVPADKNRSENSEIPKVNPSKFFPIIHFRNFEMEERRCRCTPAKCILSAEIRHLVLSETSLKYR